ncbi:MAG: response regulator transcription factor [Betaproteobacteria bacterium]
MRVAQRPDDVHARAPEASAAIRVLIADDHVVVREGLVAMIDRQPDMRVVADAADGTEAVRLWREHQPDVALVDLRMPGLDGVGVIGQVRALDPKARILILTTYDGDEDIYRGMRAGAKAYLLKDAPREQLLDCIRAVHAGNTYVPPGVAAKLAAQVSGERLTGRELEILALMAAGDSNKIIARKLDITEGTVKTHVKSVLFKLGAASRTEAAAVAARRGLIER